MPDPQITLTSGVADFDSLQDILARLGPVVVTASGTGNAIVGTSGRTYTNTALNNVFRMAVTAANTGAVTINLDGSGATALVANSGDPLAAGDLVVGAVVDFVFDGTQYRVVNILPAGVVATLQSAINLKAPIASPTFTGTVGGVTKAMVGLGNVDNTSDADKPISTATQAALDLKVGSGTLSTSIISSGVFQLQNVAGTGDAVTADLPTLTGANMQVGTLMALLWPAANTIAQPILSVTDQASNTYNISMFNVSAGELVAGELVILQFTGANGFEASGRKVGSSTIASITGLQAALDAKQDIGDDLWRRILSRPGDAPTAWTAGVTGLPEAMTALTDADVTQTADGRVLRVTGPATRAPVGFYRLDPTRIYAVRGIYRRPTDVADPAGAAVQLRARWLDRFGAAVGSAVTLDSQAPTVADGRRVVVHVVAASAGANVDTVAASGTVYFRPFIQTYESGAITDIEEVSVYDITDVGGYSPDLTSLTSRVAALESEDLATRLEVVEAATTAPTVGRYATRADAAAATIGATVDFVEVQSFSDSTPAATALYSRAASASTGSFQSADGAHWAPAWAETRLQMLGGVGDGSTDDQAAWVLARTLGKPVMLDEGLDFRVTDYSNDAGVLVRGPGRITEAVSGLTYGVLQHNIPWELSPVQFRTNAYAAKNKIVAGTAIKAVIFGGSTATNAYGVDLQVLLTAEMESLGIGVDEVLSEAVGGKKWGDTVRDSLRIDQILDDYAEQKDIIFIKLGTNDAGGSTGATVEAQYATMITNMRTALSQIRSSTYGAADDLSIVLIMPSAMSASALGNDNNRNNAWLEHIRGAYFQAAIDYTCVLYDPYAESRYGHDLVSEDGPPAITRVLDDVGVHPEPNYNYDIWGRVVHEVLRPHGGTRRNPVKFRRLTEGAAPAPSVAITNAAYARGITYQRAASGDGWPFSGMLVTEYHPDVVARQVLFGFTNAYARQLMRHWRTSAGAWSEWSGPGGVIDLTLQNSWVDQGGNFRAVGASRSADGYVYLHGVCKDGTITAGTVIAQLPAGYRPAHEMLVPATNFTATTVADICILRIKTTGDIEIGANAVSGFLGLDGISFPGVL